jgi:hypothetical protein
MPHYRVDVDKRMTYAVAAANQIEAESLALVASRGGLAGAAAKRTKCIRVVPSIYLTDEVSPEEFEKLSQESPDA